MVFCFALIAGQASNFCLETKVTKSSRRQRSFGAQGPAPGSAFSSGQRFFSGYRPLGAIEDLDGDGAFGGIDKRPEKCLETKGSNAELFARP